MEQKPISLDDLIGEITANIEPLTGESVVKSPDNPWLHNPKFVARLKEVHELVDTVKNGGQFIVIAVDDSNGEEDVKFFSANIDRPNLIGKLSRAITKVADKLSDEEPRQHK